MDFSVNFGGLEALLAEMHDIADAKRTAFQARLKNFHRLKYPVGFKTEKGRATIYKPGDIAEMALALELAQLGLTPERVVRVLSINWYPTMMALRMAAQALERKPFGFHEVEQRPDDPASMFLYFDPFALSGLTEDGSGLTPDLDQASDTFFYGGEGVVRDGFVPWTSGATHRLSLINLTALLDRLAGDPYPNDEPRRLKWRAGFFAEVAVWADSRERSFSDEALAEELAGLFMKGQIDLHQDLPDLLEELHRDHNIDPKLARKALEMVHEAPANLAVAIDKILKAMKESDALNPEA